MTVSCKSMLHILPLFLFPLRKPEILLRVKEGLIFDKVFHFKLAWTARATYRCNICDKEFYAGMGTERDKPEEF